MGRQVIVAAIDGDQEKNILVVVCSHPSEAYASKNGKHLGFIVDGKIVPDKGVQVSMSEAIAIAHAHNIMQDALANLLFCPSIGY